MTRKWSSAISLAPGNHLPPPEVTNILKRDPVGRVRVKHQVPTPEDEFGIPDTRGIAVALANMFSQPYHVPRLTNVHHAAWPRRKYEDTPLGFAYRNDPSLLMNMSIQIHNLLHVTMLPPSIPSVDVMHNRVAERNYLNTMYKCGRRAVVYARWSRTIEELANEQADEAWIENTRGFYGKRARREADNFDRLRDRMPAPQVGLLPDAEMLSSLGGSYLLRATLASLLPRDRWIIDALCAR